MLVVSDLKELFVPLPDNLLVNLQESRTVVEAFLDSLPEMFIKNFDLAGMPVLRMDIRWQRHPALHRSLQLSRRYDLHLCDHGKRSVIRPSC